MGKDFYEDTIKKAKSAVHRRLDTDDFDIGMENVQSVCILLQLISDLEVKIKGEC